ncbi:MAG TPA: TIGR00303 family protein [Methanothermobacter sp.]|nr:conserved hypothetical protein [Methanothermobacter sp. MT-2]HHW05474.1 TIGR00303 family protein [Methanothermobacter sp.]HOK72293.1 TIGR00303 family protein [Methanothermobacter sp.]HOL68905.1 TIGR00303 family protein [Methanothermobacter sp.]HPQ04956.1 TIGR00303 family protein [Methanothermobacter sp.]
MFDELKVYGSEDFLYKVKDKQPLFLCVLATTATSQIPGITGAGASPDLTEYTPAADVELIVHEAPLCLPEIPKTVVEGGSTPTPAVITKACIELAEIPFLVADAGAKIKPNLPYILINERPGEDIRTGKAVDDPRKIFENGRLLGNMLSDITEHLIIGESTPAGTTTALGVLTALGYDASFKVSASLPENPHNLKRDVVREGLENAGIKWGDKIDDPFKAVEAVGDPMIPAIAGICMGSDVPVTLAGGTQMMAVCAFIKAVDNEFDFSRTPIATTIFVAEDENSDINQIAGQIDDITIYAVDPGFEKATHRGLHGYLTGSVKEGVGAGGMLLAALLKGVSMDTIRDRIDELCHRLF